MSGGRNSEASRAGAACGVEHLEVAALLQGRPAGCRGWSLLLLLPLLVLSCSKMGEVYGWDLPDRPIFVRWFEDAEGAGISGSSEVKMIKKESRFGKSKSLAQVQSELLHQGLVEARPAACVRRQPLVCPIEPWTGLRPVLCGAVRRGDCGNAARHQNSSSRIRLVVSVECYLIHSSHNLTRSMVLVALLAHVLPSWSRWLHWSLSYYVQDKRADRSKMKS